MSKKIEKLNITKAQEKIIRANLKLFTSLDYKRVLNLNYQTAKRSITRYIRAGFLAKARKGFYFIKANPPHEFEIANKIYQPSYISFETALSFYGIIPETIYEVMSATSRTTRSFNVNNIKYSYKKIKKDCFNGYKSIKIKNATILIAEPEKALVDYFYLVVLGKRHLAYERIDLSKIKKAKLLSYTEQFQKKKIKEIINNLYAESKRNQRIIY